MGIAPPGDFQAARIIAAGRQPAGINWQTRQQAFAVIGTLQGAWLASPELQQLLPGTWVQGITLALTILGAVGRLIDQPGTK